MATAREPGPARVDAAGRPVAHAAAVLRAGAGGSGNRLGEQAEDDGGSGGVERRGEGRDERGRDAGDGARVSLVRPRGGIAGIRYHRPRSRCCEGPDALLDRGRMHETPAVTSTQYGGRLMFSGVVDF